MKTLTVGDLKLILAEFKGPDDTPVNIVVREYTRRYDTVLVASYWDDRLKGGYSAREDILILAAKFSDENEEQYVSTTLRKKK